MRFEQIRRLIGRWWWLFVAVGATAAAIPLIVASRGPDHFVSEGSYLVTAALDDQSNLVRATATLVTSDEIISTFAGVAMSNRIEQASRDALGVETTEIAEPQTFIVANTNILVIGARAGDPELAWSMATEVGNQTTGFIRDLQGIFVLSSVDPPALPEEPVDKITRSTVLSAAAAGLAAMSGLVLLAAQLGISSSPAPIRSIIDPRSGALRRRYLARRLREEFARCNAGDTTFSLAVLQISRKGRPDDLPEQYPLPDAELAAVADELRHPLRDHDLLAYVGASRFAALLPGLDRDGSQTLLEEWSRSTRRVLSHEDGERPIRVAVAVCSYDTLALTGDHEALLMAAEL